MIDISLHFCFFLFQNRKAVRKMTAFRFFCILSLPVPVCRHCLAKLFPKVSLMQKETKKQERYRRSGTSPVHPVCGGSFSMSGSHCPPGRNRRQGTCSRFCERDRFRCAPIFHVGCPLFTGLSAGVLLSCRHCLPDIPSGSVQTPGSTIPHTRHSWDGFHQTCRHCTGRCRTERSFPRCGTGR